MPFYLYRQNNSGGVFTGPATHVYVEAHSAAEADYRAVNEADIYFDLNCLKDCPCCGQRWWPCEGDWNGDDADYQSVEEVEDYAASFNPDTYFTYTHYVMPLDGKPYFIETPGT